MESNFPTGDKNMEQQIWEYVDGSSSAEEKSFIEQLIETNLAWKEKYHEILEVHQLLQSTELESPSMRFSKNVMEEIGKLHIAPATKTYINKKIIWGLAIFFITLVVGFLIYGIGSTDWSAPGTNSTDSTIVENLSKVNFNKMFSNTWVNAFMMINVVLGLFLLDNYFTQKRKAFRKQH